MNRGTRRYSTRRTHGDQKKASPENTKRGEDRLDTFFFIPHSHWEGAVFETREEYLETGYLIILRALALLDKYPSYRFVFDQVCLVKPFLEKYPNEGTMFRRFVKEGRLGIVGGMHVMPDVNMPGGESFVRQVLSGKRYFRKELGVDPTIGWLLDTFGHHAQMPQLMRLAGYRSFWAQRGVPDSKVPSELIWEGLDGTRIPFYWNPCSYGMVYGSPRALPEFAEFMKKAFDRLAPHSLGRGRAGPAGADVCLPEDHVPPMVEEFNRQKDAPFRIRISLPSDYEAEVEKRPDNRPVMKGDRNPIFQGAYSSRIELKQMTRELERQLTAAEKIGVILESAGEKVDHGNLWRAWEPMLFNQAHDLMSGVMTDHVYEDTLRSFDLSARIAREELESRLQRLAGCVDTRGQGIPIVVFNPLSWKRSDVAFAEAGMTRDDVRDFRLVDPDGKTVPIQILSVQRSTGGVMSRVKFAFIARDVPALGHSVYHLVPLKSKSSDAATAKTGKTGNVLENEFYRVKVDPAGGAVTGLTVKDGKWEALNGPANVVARELDQGDLWELYHLLDGGLMVPSSQRHGPPNRWRSIYSNRQSEAPGVVTRGPVFSEFTVSHPFGDKGRFKTTVRLYAGLRRVDIRTKILNNNRSVRYRMMVPTSIKGGKNIHEIPFGAIERPEGIECPAQNWVDYGDGSRGVALLNRGLPGNNVADGVMMLSLMRGVRIEAYGGWDMQTETGFEMGKELTFDYSLVPHAGDWKQAGVCRDGHEFNHPLMAVTAGTHDGSLPSRWGFLDVSHSNVVVSALRPSENGGAALRIHESAGIQVKGLSVKFRVPVAGAKEMNLVEDPGRRIPVKRDTLELDLRPFEIKTVWLRIGSGDKRKQRRVQ